MAAEVEGKRESYVFRIAPKDEWEKAQASGSYSGGDFDSQSGFIHLSTKDQVPGTLAMFFAGRDDLFLLKIDAEKIKAGLKFEEVPEIGTFPHYFGQDSSSTIGNISRLPLDAIIEALKLELVDGKHSLALD